MLVSGTLPTERNSMRFKNIDASTRIEVAGILSRALLTLSSSDAWQTWSLATNEAGTIVSPHDPDAAMFSLVGAIWRERKGPTTSTYVDNALKVLAVYVDPEFSADRDTLEEWGYVVTLSASASDIPPLEVTPEMKAHIAMIDEVRKNVFHEFMDGAPVRNYSAEIVAACRYVGEHWTGDDGHLVSQAADRIEQLESLVLANDKERHLSGQLKNSAEMSEEAFSDLFSRWRASAAEYNRLRKLTYIPTKGEG
jgi:hypothetical protein